MSVTLTNQSGETQTFSDEVAIQLAQEGIITSEQLPDRLRSQITGRAPAQPRQDPLAGLIPTLPPEVSEFAFPDLLPGPLGPGHPSMAQTSPEDAPELLLRSPKVQRLLLEMGIPGAIARNPAQAMNILREMGAEAAASLIAETVDPTERPAANATIQAIIGGVVGAAGTGVSKLRRGASGTEVSDLGRQAEATALAQGAERGLTAGKLSDSQFVDAMESIARAGFFGRPIMESVDDAAIDAGTFGAATIADSLFKTADPTVIGRALEDAAQGGRTAWLAASDALYSRVDALVPNARVRLGPAVKAARQQAEANKNLAPSVARLAQEVADQWEAAREAGGLTMAQARKLRSKFRSIKRGAEGDIKADEAEKAAGKIEAAITEQMNRAFQRSNPSDVARRLQNRADRHFKAGADRFDKEMIRAMAVKDPEKFYQYAIQRKSPTQIRELRNAVTKRPTGKGQTMDPAGLEAWESVQGLVLRDILMNAGLRAGGIALGEAPLTDIVRAGGKVNRTSLAAALNPAETGAGFGPKALEELFKTNPEKLSQFRENAHLIIQASKPHSSKQPFAFALSLGQAGAVGAVLALAFGAPVTAGAVGSALLFGPRALAKFMTNPKVKQWMTTGLAPNATQDQINQSALRLTALAIEEGAFPVDRPDISEDVLAPQPMSATLGGPR